MNKRKQRLVAKVKLKARLVARKGLKFQRKKTKNTNNKIDLTNDNGVNIKSQLKKSEFIKATGCEATSNSKEISKAILHH
jgi:hypothetical protein